MNRAELTREFDPAHPRFAEGTEAQQQQARREAAEELRRHQQHETAMKSGLPEFTRAHIEWLRFGQVELRGEFFNVIRGSVTDVKRSSACAWFVDAANEIVWLERPPSGPRNRAELEAHQAEREQRRSAPRQKPAWAKQ